MKNYRMTLNNW